jgi:hypothetical protein
MLWMERRNASTDALVVPWLQRQLQQIFPAFTFTGAALLPPGEGAMVPQALPSQASSSLAPAFLLCAATQLTHNSSVEIFVPSLPRTNLLSLFSLLVLPIIQLHFFKYNDYRHLTTDH